MLESVRELIEGAGATYEFVKLVIGVPFGVVYPLGMLLLKGLYGAKFGLLLSGVGLFGAEFNEISSFFHGLVLVGDLLVLSHFLPESIQDPSLIRVSFV